MILGVCFMNLFVNYSVRLGYGVVLPEMIRTQGFGRAAAATILNSYFFVYISIAPFAGYFVSTYTSLILLCQIYFYFHI